MMMHKAKKAAAYYLYFAAVIGGSAWGTYFLYDVLVKEVKEAVIEDNYYKK